MKQVQWVKMGPAGREVGANSLAMHSNQAALRGGGKANSGKKKDLLGSVEPPDGSVKRERVRGSHASGGEFSGRMGPTGVSLSFLGLDHPDL